MIKVFHLTGAPASGKSTWAKLEVAKDPLHFLRVNNDDIRAMTNGSVFSSEYEKLITETRMRLIKDGLNRDLNIIVDNVNSNKRHWDTACRLAKESGKDVQVIEKIFYEPIDVLLERNAKRVGTARVPDDVVRKFFKELGGDQLKFRNARVESFTKNTVASDKAVGSLPLVQDPNAKKAIICDLDGCLSLFNVRHKDGTIEVRCPGAHIRDPYNCHNCDKDTVNKSVATVVDAMFRDGFSILFCSGREDIYRNQTEIFLKDNLPSIEYKLFMRKEHDQRKDSIVKEEIFNEHIRPNYNCLYVLDDRSSVVKMWRETLGLTCFQVAPGDF